MIEIVPAALSRLPDFPDRRESANLAKIYPCRVFPR